MSKIKNRLFRQGVSWTPEEDALLGTMPDKKLARRLKRTYDAVAVRRLNKGIPPCNPKRKSWRTEDDKVLGSRPDDQIALLLRRTVFSVKNRRRKLGIRSKRARLSYPWTAGEDQILGTRPDPELVRKLGRSLESIRNRRRKLGVQAAPLDKAWTPRELKLLFALRYRFSWYNCRPQTHFSGRRIAPRGLG